MEFKNIKIKTFIWVTSIMAMRMAQASMMIKMNSLKNMESGRMVNKCAYLNNTKLIKLITVQLIIELSLKMNLA